MNGSRANPNAPRDLFQDFDIVYIVTDVVPFKHNFGWLKRFGEMRMDGGGSVTLQVKKRAVRPMDLTVYSYSEKDGQLLRTPIPAQGQMSLRTLPGGASCTLGTETIADELRAVRLGKIPLGSLYAPQVQSILPAAEECLAL